MIFCEEKVEMIHISLTWETEKIPLLKEGERTGSSSVKGLLQRISLYQEKTETCI